MVDDVAIVTSDGSQFDPHIPAVPERCPWVEISPDFFHHEATFFAKFGA